MRNRKSAARGPRRLRRRVGGVLGLAAAAACLAPPPASGFSRISTCYVFETSERDRFDAFFGPFERFDGSLEDFELTNGGLSATCAVLAPEPASCIESSVDPSCPRLRAIDRGDLLQGLEIRESPPRASGPSLALVQVDSPDFNKFIKVYNPGDGLTVTRSSSGTCLTSRVFNTVGFESLAEPGGPLDYEVELSGGTTFTVSDFAPPGGPGFLGLSCDTPVVRVTSLPAPGVSPALDNVRWRDSPLAFTRAYKHVTPEQVRPGAPVEYTIEVVNLAFTPAASVTVTDDLPACLDASGFDPATDVSVAGGVPFTAGYATPTVTVDLGTLNRGALRIVTIGGLRGGPSPVCCNQARVSSSLAPPPGVLSTPASGVGGPTCTVSDCAILSQLIRLPSQLADAYVLYCGLGDVRLSAARHLDVVPGSWIADLAGAPGDLELYQLYCACSDTIYLVPDRSVVPAKVRLEY